jgi:long-subunit acyl-CoA synthetase (AMP-forming)
VVDRSLELLPLGVPGELCIGGLGVAHGYLGQPDQTRERFLPDPFTQDGTSRIYRTGDRVRALPGGNLEFLGRVDDQVKIHGFRVEPAEVQIVLATHAAVRQCTVVARVDSEGDAELVAYVVCSSKVSAEELRAFLRDSLPAYMVPAKVVELEALPFTASGKIDRRALPEPASLESVVEYVAPRTALELELAQIWSELLGIERVGVNDDFFALGGHSLLATQAVIRIRNSIADVPLHSLFNAPTVSALAEAIVDAELEATDADTAASTHGP